MVGWTVGTVLRVIGTSEPGLLFCNGIQITEVFTLGEQVKKEIRKRLLLDVKEMSRKGKAIMTPNEGSENDKVKWDEEKTRSLIDICVEIMKAAKRVPGTRIPKLEWEDVAIEFNNRTGFNYHKGSLKNKWDMLRKKWTLWTNMVGKDAGLRWDSVRENVDATDEWWDKKIKEDKDHARFRKHGFKNKADLEFCFTGSYATGSSPQAPSSGVVPIQKTQLGDGVGTWFGDDACIPEQTNSVVNLEATRNTVNFEGTVDEISSPSSPRKDVPCTPSQASRSSGKRSFEGSAKRSKKKPSVNSVDEHEAIARLVTAVETQVAFNTKSQSSASKERGEVAMDILKDMKRENPISNKLYFFAMDLFADNHARDMFIACEPELRLAYLEHKFFQSASGRQLGDL
ncbi:uncharacterized protein LOC120006209 isoform X1 [Tripterygium wilfordii]|uniref:uncharacterized protein LOC120006209 isoform X1 n=1 Tax=Tripterygium wilfordii TaxID=458696 RepID=UPI0018F7F5F9|nr:uncharacterized protein LOC120006209 isoform X1 [Tripterygium wilfordii]XP_038712085.1 uncharacterized protein LOC120006209 isoform X1 [Tripterygium wilfordii]XP_038712086.1 uncharacterized protein LOC120006209 isoform X1 [Tripterygium wilfordii]XP_038712087.1 uncharacterized protein LOC120006209 isoform X1 [Tripterygium wilfordii]